MGLSPLRNSSFIKNMFSENIIMLFNYFKSPNFLFCLKIKLHRVEKVKNKKQSFDNHTWLMS